jgi:hypothetical protein
MWLFVVVVSLSIIFLIWAIGLIALLIQQWFPPDLTELLTLQSYSFMVAANNPIGHWTGAPIVFWLPN